MLYFELIAVEDLFAETHAEHGIDLFDLGMLMGKKAVKAFQTSKDDGDRKPAAKKRKFGDSDSSNLVEDDEKEEDKDA